MSHADPSRRPRHRHHEKRRTPPGTPPGTLAVDPRAAASTMRVIAYGPEQYDEPSDLTPEAARALVDTVPVVWVHVQGLGDADLIARVGKAFGLHPLAIEDVVNTHQRPKVEHFDDHLFLVARHCDTRGATLDTAQLSAFLGRGWVVSFEEDPMSCLEVIRARLRETKGHVRRAGADYLAYALLDSVVDHYFPVLETYGERLEDLEDRVTRAPKASVLHDTRAIKHDLLVLRRAMWPQRDALSNLVRDPSPLIADDTRPYLRDCYDHAVQIMDLLETYREVGSGLMDSYLSSVSLQMNEVMKVLTVIATIFIPLSFVSGIWGMNFNPKISPWNMPETQWYYGYPMALGIMAAIALLLLAYFRRRGWLRASVGE
jgi:magnesium transporter